jgi:hypothetical protein
MSKNYQDSQNLSLTDIIEPVGAPIAPVNPVNAIRYSEMPRIVPISEELPEQLAPLADELARLAAQGVTWAHMAGRVGMNSEELRKLCNAYPALLRATQFGAGYGADQVTAVLMKKALVEEDMNAIALYLKTRGGFTEPRAGSASMSVTAGDVKVSIDLDRLRNQAAEQSNLLDSIADS